VPLVGIGAGSVDNFNGFWIQDVSGLTEGTWYVDDISLISVPKTVSSQSIYTDGLQNNWVNSSTATVNFSNKMPNHSGKASIAVTSTAGYESLYLTHPQQDGSLFQTLSFWIDGGPKGGQELRVTATASGVPYTVHNLPPLVKNVWQEVIIPLESLGVGSRGDLDGFMISDRSGAAEPTYYVDDVTLSLTPAVNPLSTITVSTSNPAPISQYIYGVNSTDFANLGPGFTMARQGGTG